MAIAASVRPATTSALTSPGRQPSKDRKTNQGRPARSGAAELSLPDHVTLSAAETLSIVLRTHALEAHETSPHRLFRAEPAARRDSLGGQASLGEELAGRLDAQSLDRARRSEARRFAIAAQEGPLTHGRLGGESRERQVLGEVFHEPAVQIGEMVIGR